MIHGEKILNGLSEPELERLSKVAIWAFNKGREFAEQPTILNLFAEINWKKAKYPQDTGEVCLNCYTALMEGEK
jgi:hypothetical protein